ncbi:MAG: zinc transporter, family [Actinomycetota bacterium]|nr:zinc transporter, family [Actinomycetota bacterium]
MIGASIGLVYEGSLKSIGATALGVIAGAAFIQITRLALAGREDVHLGRLRGAGAKRILLIMVVMTIHSFTEGVAVGVSFVDEPAFGLLIAIAIAVHNIPEGLAISLTMVPAGVSPLRAAGWSVFSSLPQPLMAVPAFLAVRVFDGLLPAGLGFAAGAMFLMVATQLVPESAETTKPIVMYPTIVASAAVMLVLQFAFAT